MNLIVRLTQSQQYRIGGINEAHGGGENMNEQVFRLGGKD